MNLIVGGGCIDSHSEQTRQQISQKNKGRIWTDEAKAKLKKTPEQRKAISDRRKGKAIFVTDDQRKAQSIRVSGDKNGMYGKVRPQEWCDAHSAKMKIIMQGRMPIGGTRGKRWYHNPLTGESKMLAESVNGWVLGRKLR